ncbi:MAG: hypothetical protein ABIP51_16775 [Bacteroidia bacterium]
MSNFVNKILKEYKSVELPDLTQFVSNINSIRNKYIEMGCKLDISFIVESSISIDMIRVPNKKQGIGTEIMTAITNECDKYNVICTLSPVSDYGTPKTPLINFYKKFGFVFNQGKNKDYRFMYKMIRYPKNNLNESQRQLGQCLANKTSTTFVSIYRACPIDINQFNDRDYITLSKKFAVEHAENNHVVYGTIYHVITALVSTKLVFDAPDSNEYFYSGEPKKAKEFYVTKGPNEYEGYDI